MSWSYLFQQPSGDIGVSTEAPDRWQDQAACAGHDPDIWFRGRGGSIEEAREICWGCPVRTDCLQYALDNREIFGVWGGLSEKQRRRIRSKRRAERQAS